MKQPLHTWFIEVTDTFGGETNYSWIRRYAVKASSERGAMRVVGNYEMLSFRFDGALWHAKDACIAAYDADPDCYFDSEMAKGYRALNF